MELYLLSKIIPLSSLSRSEKFYLTKAANVAEKSIFDGSRRLGSVLVHKKRCF